MEVEPTNQVTFENVLNLSGGQPAWASMNAQIRSITKHYGTGETTVSFGPPQNNNAEALFALIQFSRPRFVWNNPSLRETASLGDSQGTVDASGHTPIENSDGGSGTKSLFGATFAYTA